MYNDIYIYICVCVCVCLCVCVFVITNVDYYTYELRGLKDHIYLS